LVEQSFYCGAFRLSSYGLVHFEHLVYFVSALRSFKSFVKPLGIYIA